MYAVAITGTFNDRSAAEAGVPKLTARVSGMPGFVAGYWIALSGEQAQALIVFDSEGEAQALARAAHGGPSNAVGVTAIKVGEVIGNA